MIVSSDLTKSNHSALKRTFWVTTSGLHGLKLWGPSERAFRPPSVCRRRRCCLLSGLHAWRSVSCTRPSSPSSSLSVMPGLSHATSQPGPALRWRGTTLGRNAAWHFQVRLTPMPESQVCFRFLCGTDVWRITRLPREPVLWPLQSWEGWGQHPHGESVRIEGGSGTPVSGLGPVWDGSRPRADAVISAVWLLRSDWILNPVRCLKMSIILWLGLRGPILPQ